MILFLFLDSCCVTNGSRFSSGSYQLPVVACGFGCSKLVTRLADE
jgi:hypothetical protein